MTQAYPLHWPPEEMWDAGGHAVQEVIYRNGGTPSERASDHASNIYRAMLRAALPPAPDKKEGK